MVNRVLKFQGDPLARGHVRQAGGFALGRIAGVKITLEWSFLLLFFLLTWSLVSTFSRDRPSWLSGMHSVAALVAAVCFVASVVGHELAHATVARRFGVGVREVRLFLLGGVSDLEQEPPSPKAEFLIALAGPAFSFMAAGMCWLVGWGLGTQAVGEIGPVATVLQWLARINVALGTFNLLPGFPLDGGRVLRASLWRWTRDLTKATRWASRVGQGTGWLFLVVGIATAFGASRTFGGVGAVNGFWLALIGMFLTTAAKRSYEALQVEQALEGITVHRLMREEGDVLEPSASLLEAAAWFLRSRERVFPVVDDSRFIGLVSMTDLAKVPRAQWSQCSVATVMTPAAELVVTSPDEPVVSALRKLAREQVSQLPVIAKDELVGVVEVSAIERWLALAPFETLPRPARAEPAPHVDDVYARKRSADGERRDVASSRSW